MVCAWCGAQLAAPAELPVGSTLADRRYQVLRVIGRGGFGITYEAGDTRLRRRVAIKELFPDSAVRHGSVVLTPPHARAAFRVSRDRFLREARVLARFTHPGIVRVFEVFEEHGTAYLVMELLSGSTLVDIMRARDAPFTEPEVLDVAARVAAALRPVHAAGVLHRDINPSNVMLTDHGQIVVIDFGLARDFVPEVTVGMTRVVTPGYAPLEQYRGEARFGPSTDVYGLAATCYRLATGRVPVSALDRDGGTALPTAHQLNPAISKSVSDAIGDGLELEASHRPQDLDSFLARLQVRLPDTPTSLLHGSPGTDRRDIDDDGQSSVAVATPVDLFDPGPAVPAPTVARVTTAGAVAQPSSAGPLRAAAPITDPDRTVAHHGSRPDPDRTVADPDGTVSDPDQTVTAGASAPGPATLVPGEDPDRTQVPNAQPRTPMPPPSAVVAAAAAAAVAAPSASQRYGHSRPGRRKVTVPLGALAIGGAMAAPVLMTALLVLVVLPLLATVGDSIAHRSRADAGIAGGWAERHLSPGLLAPARFVRNMAVSVLRASPIVGIAAVFLAAWYVLGETSVSTGALDVALRLIGGVTAAAIIASAREGSSRFRTGLGLDELVARAVPDGRTTERVVVGWLVVTIIVVAAIWLTPDPFPLP